MKIRVGFVSNSSSSSYCVVGKYFSKEQLTDDFVAKLRAERVAPFGILQSSWSSNMTPVGFEDKVEYDYLVGYEVNGAPASVVVEKSRILAEIFDCDPNEVTIHAWGFYDG